LSEAVPRRIADIQVAGTILGDHFGWVPIKSTIISVCVVGALAVSTRRVISEYQMISGEGIHEAGAALRATGSTNHGLLTTSSTLAYYAGMRWIRMRDVYGYPNEMESEEFCRVALSSDADFLGIVYPHTVTRYPGLLPLLEESQAPPPCVEFVYRTTKEPLVVLYRLAGRGQDVSIPWTNVP
jgi:hypothetical protein